MHLPIALEFLIFLLSLLSLLYFIVPRPDQIILSSFNFNVQKRALSSGLNNDHLTPSSPTGWSAGFLGYNKHRLSILKRYFTLST